MTLPCKHPIEMATFYVKKKKSKFRTAPRGGSGINKTRIWMISGTEEAGEMVQTDRRSWGNRLEPGTGRGGGRSSRRAILCSPAPEQLRPQKSADPSKDCLQGSRSAQPRPPPTSSTPTWVTWLEAGACSPRLKPQNRSVSKLNNMPGMAANTSEVVASYLIH